MPRSSTGAFVRVRVSTPVAILADSAIGLNPFFHVPLLGQGDVTLVRNFTLIGVKHDVRATDDNLLSVFEFQSPKKS